MIDGEIRFIENATIVSRTEPVSSMPPVGYILRKREIRDVVEYLTTLK